MRNIILIGMPWVGKTTIGKLLATEMRKEFIDTDEYILVKTGEDIAEHFSGLSNSEALQREIELISSIEQTDGIISLSGSVPMSLAGIELAKKWWTIIIELSAPVDILAERIRTRPDTDTRILFWTNGSLDELSAFRKNRFKTLRTHTVSADQDPSDILREISLIVNQNFAEV